MDEVNEQVTYFWKLSLYIWIFNYIETLYRILSCSFNLNISHLDGYNRSNGCQQRKEEINDQDDEQQDFDMHLKDSTGSKAQCAISPVEIFISLITILARILNNIRF